jgi:hypothetical protein
LDDYFAEFVEPLLKHEPAECCRVSTWQTRLSRSKQRLYGFVLNFVETQLAVSLLLVSLFEPQQAAALRVCFGFFVGET